MGDNSIDQILDGRIRAAVREELGTRDGGAPSPSPAGDLVDEKTRLMIQEQILISHKNYLTRREAASYLNVSDRSIAEWSARAHDDNPFPEARAGGEPRYRRSAIDDWAEREAQRQRLKLVG